MAESNVSRESAETEADREEAARHAKIKRETLRETIYGRLTSVLTDLNEIGAITHPGGSGTVCLTEQEARLYFAVERYLFPEAEAFRPENIAATEAEYLKRAAPRR